MEKEQVILGAITLTAIAGIFLFGKEQLVTADYTDPDYMKGDSEYPEETTSGNDEGGTYYYTLKPIAQHGHTRNRRLEADYPYFTGGTFLRPELLPPVRTYTLQ